MAAIVLITGMSGAGRSGAADVLEDLGFYVVDNLPTSLLPTIVDLASKPGGDIDRLALVSGRNHDTLLPEVARIRSEGHDVTLLFLEASTPVLVQRYDATRRKHPFADEAGGLLEAIEHERELLGAVKAQADLVIDTTDLNVHQLKQRLVSAFESTESHQLQLAVESFGFKHGLPLDADIVMDVRFLPNPHWVEELRPLTGHDPRVRDYVLERGASSSFLDHFENDAGRRLAELPVGGTVVSDDRDRLHGRSSSFGGDRRGAGAPIRSSRDRRPHVAPRCRGRALTEALGLAQLSPLYRCGRVQLVSVDGIQEARGARSGAITIFVRKDPS